MARKGRMCFNEKGHKKREKFYGIKIGMTVGEDMNERNEKKKATR